MSEWISPDRQEYHCWFDNFEEADGELPAMMKRRNADAWERDVSNRPDGLSHRARSWTGTVTVEDAIGKLKYGWPELLATLTPMIQELFKSIALDETNAVQIEVRRRKRHRGDYGDTLDMHRVWGGQLDTAWERPVRSRRMVASQQYASIFVDTAALCNVLFNDTLWRAAAAVCMVETLTRMGINTEVWTGNSGTHCYGRGPRMSWYAIRAKAYTQPLNEERLSGLCSLAGLRVYGFAMISAAPYRTEPVLGFPLETGLVKPLRDRQEAGERVFRVGRCYSKEQAVLEIKRVIDQLKSKEAA